MVLGTSNEADKFYQERSFARCFSAERHRAAVEERGGEESVWTDGPSFRRRRRGKGVGDGDVLSPIFDRQNVGRGSKGLKGRESDREQSVLKKKGKRKREKRKECVS